MNKKKSKDSGTGTIALNKKARFDYSLEDRYEAGVALQGWEVKALRGGRLSFNESYAIIKGGEIFLFGTLITPLASASTHVIPDDRRTRKLLLHKREINKLVGAVSERATPWYQPRCTGRTTASRLKLRSPKANRATTNARQSKTATGNATNSAPCVATIAKPEPGRE